MTSIRILEHDNNRRGDLFGRLMADLFVALGYEQPRLNVHKSGRELDLSANHRLETRRAIAECKATVAPIGGDEVNKFVGALDAEHKGKTPVTGYFISLAGFRETALEQEKQRQRTKIILLKGEQVVDELVKGRILKSKEQAIDLAGRCCSEHNQLILDPEPELLAHERGWVWAVYYTQGKVRTHFVLIHSDGTPLARAVAEQVIGSDLSCGGILHTLACLNPAPSEVGQDATQVAEALVAYGEYLAAECGTIQLDGLPADSEVGSRRLHLENLFVPLHLDVPVEADGDDRRKERLSAGAVLANHSRLAILAAPGGGKSTLLKRLAVAYADLTRRAQIDDDLPQRDWLPLFFRCRELRDLARSSFSELLETLSQRERVRQYAAVFLAHVDCELLAGRVLLLVDGLDEITDPGDRAAFVCTLRTALQAYPGIAFVVTSREAGFRHVAAHLAPVCTHATLSPFDAADIERLCVAWHREVVGTGEKVLADARQLAATIARNDRIQRLTLNPLLLTTLLLVKRWVGALPIRRTVLYGKAVEVLLMTWNTEGHEPIPEEEALPQLCYVASTMMLEGVQKISRPRLAALLHEARSALPTELGYVKGTVEEFIHRVEDRSSLLMMSGHDVEAGRLVEFFEFRHLTFQEFLTARAMVEGWHPGRDEEDTLVSVLEPQFEKEAWREVIPLAAVLGGKETEALMRRLTEIICRVDSNQINRDNAFFLALGNCLADEAPALRGTIQAALRELVRIGSLLEGSPFISILARGRYGIDLRDEAAKLFLSPDTDLLNSAQALTQAIWWQTVETESGTEYATVANQAVELMKSSETLRQCEGALTCTYLCYRLHLVNFRSQHVDYKAALQSAGTGLMSMLFSEHPSKQYASALGLVWLGACRVSTSPIEAGLISRLFTLWRHNPDVELKRVACWALASQPLNRYQQGAYCDFVPREEVVNLIQGYEELEDYVHKSATLIVAWYLHALDPVEIVSRARELLEGGTDHRTIGLTLRELLAYLGKPFVDPL